MRAMLCLLLSTSALALGPATGGSDLTERAREIHFSSIVLDTHVDTTSRLTRTWDFSEEHKTGHVDLPRMKQGGLNALFFAVYVPGSVTGPPAVKSALERIAAVRRLAEDFPGEIAFCTTAEEVRAARGRGRIAALMGIEGGHMIAESLPVLRTYALLGVRYLTLTHSVNTAWADSSGDKPAHGGLTPFGKEVVRELNRLGIMVDVSHVSDETFWDVLGVSEAPVIASHSSCRALCGNPRNMTDEMIKALAAKGGVIQINYHIEFLDEAASEYGKKAEPVFRKLLAGKPEPEDFSGIIEEVARRIGPPPKVSWQRIVEHIDHAVRIAGADHVGLGSDFDGAQMPVGMESARDLPKITEALLRRGYTEADIRKILGENTLRLMADVEKAGHRPR